MILLYTDGSSGKKSGHTDQMYCFSLVLCLVFWYAAHLRPIQRGADRTYMYRMGKTNSTPQRTMSSSSELGLRAGLRCSLNLRAGEFYLIIGPPSEPS